MPYSSPNLGHFSLRETSGVPLLAVGCAEAAQGSKAYEGRSYDVLRATFSLGALLGSYEFRKGPLKSHTSFIGGVAKMHDQAGKHSLKLVSRGWF